MAAVLTQEEKRRKQSSVEYYLRFIVAPLDQTNEAAKCVTRIYYYRQT